jgi:hypothetical protein
MSEPKVTYHAIDRYRILHPVSVRSDVERAWLDGEPMLPELVTAITQRGNTRPGSEYRLTPCGGGVLVSDGANVVTVLRLSPMQRALVRKPVETVEAVDEALVEPERPLDPFGERLQAHGLKVRWEGAWMVASNGGDEVKVEDGPRVRVRHRKMQLFLGADDAFRFVVDRTNSKRR